ncbi:hypothetical protein, partial [Klebsiella pneumoniae]|uniref:hypothetical protein n=1 Tax=Klebsiella pneumoniae TaxID=573 RepID=UPI001E4D4B5C
HRHVQILADQHALAGHVTHIVERLEGLGHDSSILIVSPMRIVPPSITLLHAPPRQSGFKATCNPSAI